VSDFMVVVNDSVMRTKYGELKRDRVRTLRNTNRLTDERKTRLKDHLGAIRAPS
jgi:hypothetical protein